MTTRRVPAGTPSSTKTIAQVAPGNNRRETLLAIRDRLAFETDDTLWTKHKRECMCICGMGDGRLLVALVKELRDVETALADLPDEEKEASAVDSVIAAAAKRRDELAARRAARLADPPAS